MLLNNSDVIMMKFFNLVHLLALFMQFEDEKTGESPPKLFKIQNGKFMI